MLIFTFPEQADLYSELDVTTLLIGGLHYFQADLFDVDLV